MTKSSNCSRPTEVASWKTDTDWFAVPVCSNAPIFEFARPTTQYRLSAVAARDKFWEFVARNRYAGLQIVRTSNWLTVVTPTRSSKVMEPFVDNVLYITLYRRCLRSPNFKNVAKTITTRDENYHFLFCASEDYHFWTICGGKIYFVVAKNYNFWIFVFAPIKIITSNRTQ